MQKKHTPRSRAADATLLLPVFFSRSSVHEILEIAGALDEGPSNTLSSTFLNTCGDERGFLFVQHIRTDPCHIQTLFWELRASIPSNAFEILLLKGASAQRVKFLHAMAAAITR